MRIGLLRHFKVNKSVPSQLLLSHQEVVDWFREYDKCNNLHLSKIDTGKINWTKCYSSPLPRARITAQSYFQAEIVINTALAELDILHKVKSPYRLPFLLWAILIRLKSSKKNIIQDYEKRLSDFVNELLQNDEEDMLIVSHYFTMKMLRKELLRRGFKNSSYKPNAYGELFVFEK